MSKDKDYDEYCLKAGIENRNCSTDTTHYEGCWDSGPKHYECVLRELDWTNKVLLIAIGLLSTYPKFSSMPSEYTLEYVINIAQEKDT